jgi:hypothetical protein
MSGPVAVQDPDRLIKGLSLNRRLRPIAAILEDRAKSESSARRGCLSDIPPYTPCGNEADVTAGRGRIGDDVTRYAVPRGVRCGIAETMMKTFLPEDAGTRNGERGSFSPLTAPTRREPSSTACQDHLRDAPVRRSAFLRDRSAISSSARSEDSSRVGDPGSRGARSGTNPDRPGGLSPCRPMGVVIPCRSPVCRRPRRPSAAARQRERALTPA